MTKGDITFNSIVLIKKTNRKGFVTGITYHNDKIVGVAVHIPQSRPQMYLPSEIQVIRY